MRISNASLVLALLSNSVVARNCNGGLSYCGKTLLQIGILQFVLRRDTENSR
jgi:hypothetical protein